MDFKNIKELIELVDSSSLAFFELQNFEGHIIKMDKSLIRGIGDNNLVKSNNTLVNSKENIENFVVNQEETNTTEKETSIYEKDVDIITSPMVGTFYSSTSPESVPFVKIGDTISKGKVICIIEAMKLMNEIESEYSGRIVKCLVNDGDMVEYGQPLFEIKEEK